MINMTPNVEESIFPQTWFPETEYVEYQVKPVPKEKQELEDLKKFRELFARFKLFFPEAEDWLNTWYTTHVHAQDLENLLQLIGNSPYSRKYLVDYWANPTIYDVGMIHRYVENYSFEEFEHVLVQLRSTKDWNN